MSDEKKESLKTLSNNDASLFQLSVSSHSSFCPSITHLDSSFSFPSSPFVVSLSFRLCVFQLTKNIVLFSLLALLLLPKLIGIRFLLAVLLLQPPLSFHAPPAWR